MPKDGCPSYEIQCKADEMCVHGDNKRWSYCEKKDYCEGKECPEPEKCREERGCFKGYD